MLDRMLERYSHFLILYGIGAVVAGYMTWWFSKPLAVVFVLMILRYGWRHRDDENPTEEELDAWKAHMWPDDDDDDDEPEHLWARPRP